MNHSFTLATPCGGFSWRRLVIFVIVAMGLSSAPHGLVTIVLWPKWKSRVCTMYVECSLVPALKVWWIQGRREMKKKTHQLSKGSGISPLPCTRIYQESLLSQQHQKSALCLQTTERFKSSVSTDSKNFPIWRHINIKIFKIHYVEMKDCINADLQLINKTNSPLPRHTVRNISSLQLYNNILGFFFFF